MAAAAPDFARMMPGFDFLKNLAEGAGSAMPQLGSWVAPTLDPEELDKRVEELKTVQFWLEQNARMIATTVQALEVQRMTLSTLKGMNLQFGDLAKAFSVKPPSPDAARTTAQTTAQKTAHTTAHTTKKSTATSRSSSAGAGAGVVDPMQWWGSLTQQFAQLASKALQETGRAASAATAASAESANAAKATAATGATGSTRATTATRATRATTATGAKKATKAKNASNASSGTAVPRSSAAAGAAGLGTAGRRKPR